VTQVTFVGDCCHGVAGSNGANNRGAVGSALVKGGCSALLSCSQQSLEGLMFET